MARGKHLTIEDRIEKACKEYNTLNEKIAELKEKANEKDAEIKDLLNEKRNAEMKSLLDYVEASGKTPDEILKILKGVAATADPEPVATESN